MLAYILGIFFFFFMCDVKRVICAEEAMCVGGCARIVWNVDMVRGDYRNDISMMRHIKHAEHQNVNHTSIQKKKSLKTKYRLNKSMFASSCYNRYIISLYIHMCSVCSKHIETTQHK